RFLKAAGTPSTRPCRDSFESLIVGKMKAGQGRQRASNGDPVGDTRDRLGRTYDGYRRSGRKRRSWAADNPGNAAMRQELLEHVMDRVRPVLRDGDVLDIGCGTGWWLRALENHGVPSGRLHGVDLLGDRLAAAAQRVPGADLREADARRLPYPNARFRVVILFTVLSSLATSED